MHGGARGCKPGRSPPQGGGLGDNAPSPPGSGVDGIWLSRGRKFAIIPNHFEPIDRPTRQMFGSHLPAMGPERGMVNLWGRLARTKWALTAIWLGGGRLGRCRVRIHRLLRLARRRTSHLHFVFRGNVHDWIPLRPRLALAPSSRSADNVDDCRRWVG